MLRSRLKDLEDDTRSSVSDDRFLAEKEGELVNMLRKELAKVENEKANLEKEFMNQLSNMANDNRKQIYDLQDKLIRSQALNEELRDQLKSKLKGDLESERLMELFEHERESHNKELERMKENLASSDVEIAESRREMDHLHEQLEDVHGEKEELVREVTDLRLAYSEEQRRAESLREELKQSNNTVAKLRGEISGKDTELKQKDGELGEMNDTIIELEGHKDMLVSENTDLRKQLRRQEGTAGSSQSSPSSESPSKQANTPAMTDEDKNQLEESIELLESRLQKFQSKLVEKDTTIENLASKLSEERKRYKALKGEIRALKEEQQLQKNNSQQKVSHSTPSRQPPSPLSVSSPVAASRNSCIDNSPRTPVSGIVASFENRIQTGSVATTAESSSPSNRDDSFQQPPSLSLVQPDLCQNQAADAERALVIELQEKVRREKDLVKKLRLEFGNAKEESARKYDQLQLELNQKVEEINRLRAKSDVDAGTLMDLQDRLRHEQAVVKELRAKLSEATAGENSEYLKEQLKESQREVSVLLAKIEGYEAARLTMQEKTRKEQTELSKLRMKSHQATSEKRDLENKITASEREVERLKTELSYTIDMYSVQEEKKEEESEEIARLLSKIGSLQTELNAAMTEIDRLLSEMEGLKNALRREQVSSEDTRQKAEEDGSLAKKTQKLYDSQMNQLKVELTKTQIAKNEMETELEKKVRELEEEIEAIETEAEEELEEKDRQLNSLREKLAEKEAMISRLEVEQSQICSSMNNMSACRQDEMEDLQAELIAMTSKTSVQTREIESLKIKIKEVETQKIDTEEKYKRQIRDFEDIIKSNQGFGQNEDFDRLKTENNQLRDSIRDVKLERRLLQERLESLTTDKTASRSTQILRDRNNALKEEVEKLTKRLKKMEASITRFAI